MDHWQSGVGTEAVALVVLLVVESCFVRVPLDVKGAACDIEAGGEKKVVEELWHRREHVCNERARERHLCQGRDDDEGDGLEEQVPLLAIAPLGHPVEGPQEYDGGTEQRHYRPDMLADVIEGVQLGDQRENVQDEGGEDHRHRSEREAYDDVVGVLRRHIQQRVVVDPAVLPNVDIEAIQRNEHRRENQTAKERVVHVGELKYDPEL
mmetsp:Transcript_48176/g.159655  ORF Transcript_48176/g.159655 Transcript_48176/m.159655 type:complete len:208 (+) Transcript_48176:740-1363(+)